jgi:branched-chain amino acid transport system substrate-binding protein
MNKKRPALALTLATIAVISAACSSRAPGGSANNAAGGSATGGSNSMAAADAKALGIDLSKCATDPTKPLSTPVQLGESFPKSGGPASIFAPIGAGVIAAIGANNATAGNTQVKLTQADDQFDPAKTLTAAKQLIDQDNVAALTTVLGTSNIIGLNPLLKADCVPLITAQAGGAEANSPKANPWTVNWTLPSAVDARIWVEDVKTKFPQGAKIAIFAANDSSGKDYINAINHYVAGTNNKIVTTQTIEDTDSAAPASQVTTMRSSGANVVMSAPTGGQCIAEMKEIAGQGWTPTQYMSYTCPSSLFDLTGSAANGVNLNQYIKDPTRPPYNTDPAVTTAKAALAQYSPGTPANTTSFGGMVYEEAMLKAIANAKASALGLTRLGLLQAATHMEYQSTLMITGVTYHLNYPADEVALEGAQISSYNASSKTFTYGKTYDFDGQMTGVASS